MQSLSEIDTTAKRASKAAGFSWGIAEEIGKATRNLELFGLPGITNLNLYNINSKDAKKYINWIISDEGKKTINNFRKNNVQLFFFNHH